MLATVVGWFPPPVLVDEIQYAPGLLPHVKKRIDAARRPGAFWLTGSQQFRAMRGITETLEELAASRPDAADFLLS